MISTLRYLKRNRFFSGKLLTPEDFGLEQDYFREKSKLHNRYHHGFGIVFGLDVSGKGREIVISRGLAIDCQGNEIIVPEPMKQVVRGSDSATTLFLTISYIEVETDPVPALHHCAEMENSRIEERSSAVFSTVNANQGHRHFNGRWAACGKSHGLTIARLRLAAGQWRIDRRLRPPIIK